jgi:hypothetical protein
VDGGFLFIAERSELARHDVVQRGLGQELLLQHDIVLAPTPNGLMIPHEVAEKTDCR